MEQKEIRKFRRTLDVSQTAFWDRLDVSLTYGHIFETCKKVMPPRILHLFELIYGDAPLTYLAKLRHETLEELLQRGK